MMNGVTTAPDVSDRANGSLAKGRLGVLAITFFVVSAAGPLVAMAGGIPITMLFGNGAGIPALFVALTVILALFARGYTAMAREVQDAGAFYAMVRSSLGNRAGGATGGVALLGYNAMQIGLYGLFGAAVKPVVDPLIGANVPWWSYSLVALLTIAALGYRQVDLSVRVLGLLCVSEYLVVLVIDAAVLLHGGSAGLSPAPFSSSVVTSGMPMVGLMLGFGAFIGFEATAIYSEEAKDPARSVPLATYLSLLIIGIFYAVSSWSLVMALGMDHVMSVLRSLNDPTEVLFAVAERYVGGPIAPIMRVLFITSIFAAMLAFHNALARYAYAMGRDGLLHDVLGRTHSRHASPHIGSLAQSAIAAVALLIFALIGADPVLTVFTLPTAIGTLAILAMLVAASLAVVVFLARRGYGALQLGQAILAFLLIGVIGAMAATRFDVLSGTSTGLVSWLPATVLLAAFAGAIAGGRQPAVAL